MYGLQNARIKKQRLGSLSTQGAFSLVYIYKTIEIITSSKHESGYQNPTLFTISEMAVAKTEQDQV